MEQSKRVLLLLAMVAALFLGVPSADGRHYRTGKPLRKSHRHKPVYKPLALSVQGVVLCQNCSYVGTRSLKDAQALQGAKVQLACRDWRYKTFLYDTATTDAHGYFFMKVPKFDFSKHNPIKTCRVFLVSSPSPTCNVRTNINSGKFGSFLLKEKDYPDHTLYTVGPFAFAPPYPCKRTPPIYEPPIATPPIYKAPPPIYKAPAPTPLPIYAPPPKVYAPPPY